MPALLRRRELLWPTLWGWLVALALLGAAVLVIGSSLGGWLAVTEPVSAGGPARILVVEGPGVGRNGSRIAAYVREHGYARVITSGGPIEDPFSAFPNYAERAAAVLRPLLPGLPVDAVPAPPTQQDRTYASAVWVRDWAGRQGLPLDAIDVYTAGAHARRSRMLYAMAFGEATRVGIVADAPVNVDLQRWWTSSEAAKSVMGEVISLAWTACCFAAPPRGSHEERWAVPPATLPAASAP